MNILSVQNLIKTIDGKQILNSISFSVKRNEFTCIVGPSGCGKSTLLKILAGVDNQDSGKIYIDGKDAAAMKPGKRKISIVFQDYSLYPTMNVFDNIALGLKIAKAPAAEINEKVKRIAESLSLTEHLKKSPMQLSGGQQQRVAFGRAMVMESDIILLDEPFSALDVQLKLAMQEDLLTLVDKFRLTVILVTHDLEEALTLGQQVIVMNQGNIEKAGNSEEIYRAGDNPFVQDFVIKQINNKYKNLKHIVENK